MYTDLIPQLARSIIKMCKLISLIMFIILIEGGLVGCRGKPASVLTLEKMAELHEDMTPNEVSELFGLEGKNFTEGGIEHISPGSEGVFYAKFHEVVPMIWEDEGRAILICFMGNKKLASLSHLVYVRGFGLIADKKRDQTIWIRGIPIANKTESDE